MTIELWEIAELLLVGLAAGTLGGLLGIGGSVIMIPAMAFIFHERPWHNQHLYQGAAMIVNLAVAFPAAARHYRSGSLPREFVKVFIPATMLAMIAGVFISNQIPSRSLRMLFAAFLVYIGVASIVKVLRRAPDHAHDASRVTTGRSASIGAVTGVIAGVLGIGGGIVSVPLTNALCRLPIRNCIAASAMAMVFSAPLGAALKVSTLSEHGARWTDAVVMALALAPTALLGGYFGAGLTYRLPLAAVRLVFAALVMVMAGRMFDLY